MNKGLSFFTTLIFGIIIGALGSYVFFHETVKAPETPEESNALQSYEWKFVESEPDQTGMLSTMVTLLIAGKSYPLGSYNGTCEEVRTGEAGVTGEMNDPNEVSRVQCWFAGAGDEIGVFEENGKMIVKAGELGEGNDEEAPFRGNLKTILKL